MGHPWLVSVPSQLYTPFIQCDPSRYALAGSLAENSFSPTQHVDALKEVIVSVGAYGALSAATSPLIDPRGEVIIMDLNFDCCALMTRFAGGAAVFVHLKPISVTGANNGLRADAWKFDPVQLE
ncbi:Kynurenine---oxoglutarate transaminase [Fasciola gigantica]|uniref:Kynurenine---oxoglutarate transaminase n=1 Tax=Fasciola gigantica TaxID=46835 RepID=A0A504YHJ9_FASGI|nr:Kynurenine---oxoglutarate transaminase [Fasciola gigantica]